MSHEPEKTDMHGTIVLRNSKLTEIRLTVEPWGNEYTLLPGKTVEIVFSGPSGGQLEIETGPEEVVLWGWEGSVLNVKDGSNAPFPQPVPYGLKQVQPFLRKKKGSKRGQVS